MMIAGGATVEGTSRYAKRFLHAAPGHFRTLQHLMASSIGLGTYGGRDDAHTDRMYEAAISRALSLGCNVIDTAVAYRHQSSERVIGRTLTAVLRQAGLARDEVILSSKAGFLPFDRDYPGTVWEYYQDTFLRPGIVLARDVVMPGHCIAPAFLQHQIDASRQNLGCAMIDIFYLHNPDAQLQAIRPQELYARIHAAFEVLEGAAEAGQIGVYGITTWKGFTTPRESPDLSLVELVRCAREVAGDRHRFRVIMFPVNVAGTEAGCADCQSTQVERRLSPLLRTAQDVGLSVIAASTLNGGRLSQDSSGPGVSGDTPGARGDTMTAAQLALHRVRLISGITTALVGMSDPKHVDENMQLAMIAAHAPTACATKYVSAGAEPWGGPHDYDHSRQD